MKELAVKDRARMQRAYELDAEVARGAKDVMSGILQMGVALKTIRDEELFLELGYQAVEEYADDRWGISRRTMYYYIEVIEKLPAAIVQRVAQMGKPLSLRKLTALPMDTFEGVSDEEIERLVGLTDEELDGELAKNYDREKLGGRGPADLRRELITKAQYRSQRQKLNTLNEKAKRLEAELAETREAATEAQALLDDAKATDKGNGPLLKRIEELQARLGVLEGERAKSAAGVARGREVGARSLEFIGEVEALCQGMYDGVRVDSAAEWVNVTDAIDAAKSALDDLRGRMADVILRRINAGEVEDFALDEPRNELEKADTTVRVMSRKRGVGGQGSGGRG